MVSLCGRGFESHQLHLHRIDRGLAVMWQVPCRCFLESLMDGALHLVAMLQEELSHDGGENGRGGNAEGRGTKLS